MILDLTPLLSVIRLSVCFTRPTPQLALSGIEFSLPKNSIIGIVGESGSGKSLTAMSIMGLLDQQNTQVEGQVEFQGQPIFPDQPKRVRSLRGKEIAMIFQDPMTALNPAKRCGAQVDEMLMLQGGFDREQAKKELLSCLSRSNSLTHLAFIGVIHINSVEARCSGL